MTRALARNSLLLGLLAVVLAGCAGSSRPKPKELEAYTPQIAGRQVWNRKLSGVDFPLSVAVNAGRFTVASNDGTVLAFDASNGAELWRADVGAKLAAGVGSDGRYSAVVTRGGDLVALDGGQVTWRMPVGSQVSTAPLVAGERVFVLAVDRSVHAFDALDGRKLWSLKRPGDPLTLSQGGVLAPFKNTLLVGQGARLAGVDPLRGTVQWEVPLATPRGTNEVERLADLVGPLSRAGDRVCARAFQSAVACADAERGTLAWTKNAGGTEGLGGDEQFIFGADASDRLSAWRRSDGDSTWTSDRFLYRGLSAPLSLGKAVVFGDAQGWVHWLSADKGEPQLRLATDGSAIVAAPVVSGTTVLVATKAGGIYAFRPE
jgi:outer membrane protein assembly factor BamB